MVGTRVWDESDAEWATPYGVLLFMRVNNQWYYPVPELTIFTNKYPLVTNSVNMQGYIAFRDENGNILGNALKKIILKDPLYVKDW